MHFVVRLWDRWYPSLPAPGESARAQAQAQETGKTAYRAATAEKQCHMVPCTWTLLRLYILCCDSYASSPKLSLRSILLHGYATLFAASRTRTVLSLQKGTSAFNKHILPSFRLSTAALSSLNLPPVHIAYRMPSAAPYPKRILCLLYLLPVLVYAVALSQPAFAIAHCP